MNACGHGRKLYRSTSVRIMSEKLIARNKKAFYDYHIVEKIEAGIVLVGTEVKSLREGRVNLKEAYARISGGEVWLDGCHISPYSHGNIHNHEPLRRRKLLLHRREIQKLLSKTTQKGLTLVPLSLYFKNGVVKTATRSGQGQEGLRQT